MATDEGTFAMSFVTDISERRAAEKALETARRTAQRRERLADVGALTAKIVHDLGNPIAGLSMSVQQIARRLARNPTDPLETVRAATEHMAAAVRRLDALTHDFKTFLREQRLNLVPLHLGEFLRDLLAVWEPEARRRKIAVALEVGGGDPQIRADPDQLHRLFDNLVESAFEAIERGPGTVTLAADVSGAERVRIAVRDTGPGIPAGANVFDLFETSKADGTGLGLTIARQVAEAHGGGIGIASPGTYGAVFEVERSREPVRPCSEIGILIVDGDLAFRHGLAALLRDDAHLVHHCALPDELPPLHTLDWVGVLVAARQLESEDALAFADRFHCAHPDCPIVLATAYRTPTIDAQAAVRAFVHLVEKPIDYDDLHLRLHRLAR